MSANSVNPEPRTIRLPTPATAPVYHDRWGHSIRSSDKAHADWCEHNGGWDTAEMQWLCDHIKPGMHCVDVGANSGAWTIALAKLVGPEGRVYAFEPSPTELPYLEKTIAENGYYDVKVHGVACGAKNGKVRFAIEHTTGLHRFTVTPSAAAVMDVYCCCLDDVIPCDESARPRVDFLKVDVQGHELSVMLGMPRIFAANPSLVMVLEFEPALMVEAGYDPILLPQWLNTLGFSVTPFDCKRGLLHPMTPQELLSHAYGSQGHVINILADRPTLNPDGSRRSHVR